MRTFIVFSCAIAAITIAALTLYAAPWWSAIIAGAVIGLAWALLTRPKG
jgi:hypothetical protein